MDSSNEKGLFRRGEAHLAVNDFELARADFQKVLQLYPSNKAAKVQLLACQQKIREQHEREKKMYANMFQRLADKDSKVSGSTLQNPGRTEWVHVGREATGIRVFCLPSSALPMVQREDSPALCLQRMEAALWYQAWPHCQSQIAQGVV